MPVASKTDPSPKPFAITKSDSPNDNRTFRSLRVAGAGDVTVVLTDGTSCTIPSVLAGETLPVEGVRVATSSTASGFTGYE